MEKAVRTRVKRREDEAVEMVEPEPKATRARPMPKSRKDALTNHQEEAYDSSARQFRHTKETSPSEESTGKAKTGTGQQKGGKKPVARNEKRRDDESKKASSDENMDHSDTKSDSMHSDVEVQEKKPQKAQMVTYENALPPKAATKGKGKENSPPPSYDDDDDEGLEEDDPGSNSRENSDVVGGLAHNLNRHMQIQSDESEAEVIANSSGEIQEEEKEEKEEEEDEDEEEEDHETSLEKPKKVAASKSGGGAAKKAVPMPSSKKETSPPIEPMDKAKTGTAQQKGGKRPVARNQKGRDDESKKADERTDHSDAKADLMRSDVKALETKPQRIQKGAVKKIVLEKAPSKGKEKSPPPSHDNDDGERGEDGPNERENRNDQDVTEGIGNSSGENLFEEEKETTPEKPKKVAATKGGRGVAKKAGPVPSSKKEAPNNHQEEAQDLFTGQSRNTKEASTPVEITDQAKIGTGQQKGGINPVARNEIVLKVRDGKSKKAPPNETTGRKGTKSDLMNSEVEVQEKKQSRVQKGLGKKAVPAKTATKGKENVKSLSPLHGNDDEDMEEDDIVRGENGDVVGGLALNLNRNMRIQSDESDAEVNGNSSGEIQVVEEESSPEKPKKVAALKSGGGVAKKAGPSVANRNATKAAAPPVKKTETSRAKTAKATDATKTKAGASMSGTKTGKAPTTAARKETTANDEAKPARSKDPRKSYALRSKVNTKLFGGI